MATYVKRQQTLVFTESAHTTKSQTFQLHGALHYYLTNVGLRKHCWRKTGTRLTDQIRSGLENNQYPLFVAEGKPEMKLEQIQRHGYLWHCLNKLANIKSPLFVYGHSLGESDRHLVDIIAKNINLPEISIGLFGDAKSPANKKVIKSCEQIVKHREKFCEK